MNTITVGHTYRPATLTRFANTTMGCSDHPQPDTVQFGMTTPHKKLHNRGLNGVTKEQARNILFALLIGGPLVWWGVTEIGQCAAKNPPKMDQVRPKK